jgi:hypothetical protein
MSTYYFCRVGEVYQADSLIKAAEDAGFVAKKKHVDRNSFSQNVFEYFYLDLADNVYGKAMNGSIVHEIGIRFSYDKMLDHLATLKRERKEKMENENKNKVQLNDDFEAEIVDNDTIKVGCQKFSTAKLEELLKAAKEWEEPLLGGSESFQRIADKLRYGKVKIIDCNGNTLLIVEMPHQNNEWVKSIFRLILEEMENNDKLSVVNGRYIPLPSTDHYSIHNRCLYLHDGSVKKLAS